MLKCRQRVVKPLAWRRGEVRHFILACSSECDCAIAENSPRAAQLLRWSRVQQFVYQCAVSWLQSLRGPSNSETSGTELSSSCRAMMVFSGISDREKPRGGGLASGLNWDCLSSSRCRAPRHCRKRFEKNSRLFDTERSLHKGSILPRAFSIASRAAENPGHFLPVDQPPAELPLCRFQFRSIIFQAFSGPRQSFIAPRQFSRHFVSVSHKTSFPLPCPVSKRVLCATSPAPLDRFTRKGCCEA